MIKILKVGRWKNVMLDGKLIGQYSIKISDKDIIQDIKLMSRSRINSMFGEVVSR